MTPSENVNVGGHGHKHAPRSSQSSGASSRPAASGENSQMAVRSGPTQPVNSAVESQEAESADYGSTSVSESPETTPCNSPLTRPKEHQTRELPDLAMDQEKPVAERELHHDVYTSIQRYLHPGGRNIADCYLNASEQPPITAESLAELDMARIINNPKLRHDVNFDRELHFRPNLDGLKGRDKLMAADKYYLALEGELFIYGLAHGSKSTSLEPQNEAYWHGILTQGQKRLPKIFQAVRDILKTLVPEHDQKAVVERLDVELLMQEIMNGMCDLIDLGNWLSKVLKNHCAPMRDELVDCMQKQITQGAVEERPTRLVNGIRALLNILELMKLDVANHQIRHMRPLLVEDTVNFHRRYNAHRMCTGKLDVRPARIWLDNEMDMRKVNSMPTSHLEAVSSALLTDLLFAPTATFQPTTFYLDIDRLRALRMDLQSIIYHKICRDILFEMTGARVPKHEIEKAAASLYLTVTAIVGITGRFVNHLENIAAEIMRVVLMLEGRNIPFDMTLLEFVEQRLHEDIIPGSSAFEDHAHRLTQTLLPRIQISVAQNVKYTALHLQDKFVPPGQLPAPPYGFGASMHAPASLSQPVGPIEDVIRRFTHIVVLHWQVWGDLVYLAPREEIGFGSENGSSNTSSETSASSANSSPTVPVAHAVYAPGRKWLPIGVTVKEVPSGFPTPAASPAPDAQQDGSSNEQDEPASSGPSAMDPKEEQRA